MICAAAELIRIGRLSSRLSLITAVSLTNALLGAVSELVVEMAHRGGGPWSFVATQPDGRLDEASKFSKHGSAMGVGVGVAPGGVGVGVRPVGSATVSLLVGSATVAVSEPTPHLPSNLATRERSRYGC